MADVPALRRTLALALATDEVATQVTSSPQSSDPDKDVARQARQSDLVSHKSDVRRLLGQAVRGGTVFFRGTQALAHFCCTDRRSMRQDVPRSFSHFP